MAALSIESALESDAHLARFVDAFLDRTLDQSLWHHRAHCLVTGYLILKRSADEVKRDLPRLISEYNVATGGQNTDTSGYHHTITIFYIEAIEAYFSTLPVDGNRAKCAALLNSEICDKNYIRRFYSNDLLASPAARKHWIAPDLAVRHEPIERIGHEAHGGS